MQRRILNMTTLLPGLTLGLALGLTGTAMGAEEYMKRGSSVGDYEQALDRVLERHRGLTTGRERQAAPAKPAPAKPAAVAAKPAAPVSHAPAAPVEHGVYVPPAQADAQETGHGLSIYFGYDSARLTRDATDELGKLGEVLAGPKYRDLRWLIEGHTDASGSEDYNQRLSEERAEAARRYLIEVCGIAPDRLIAVGRGKLEPYDRANPHASVNRRVRITPAGDG